MKDWNDALQTYGVDAMQQALAALYVSAVPSGSDMDANEEFYTGEYVFIEDLAAQNLLPRRFPLEGRLVDLNEWVRQILVMQDAARMEAVEAAYDQWREKQLATKPEWF